MATRVEELERLVPEWQDLVADCAEPNAFFEPFVLIPAFEHLSRGADVRVLFLRAPDGRLVGVLPLERHRWSPAIPAPHFSTWRHKYCFLCTPLVRRTHEDAAVDSLFTWLGGAGIAGHAVRLLHHADGGAFARALDARARRDGRIHRVTGSYERAFVETNTSPEAYFRSGLTKKRRQEVRSKRRRLESAGEVAVLELTSREEVGTWLPRFFALEDSGWKGRLGTSMTADADDRAFLESAARRSRGRHRVEILAMTLDGEPLSAAVNFRSDGAVFTFKVAYDEAHATCSPGIQLEWEFLARALADPATQWADSCTAAESLTTLASLWSGRRRVRDVDVVAATRLGRSVLALGEPLLDLDGRARAWFRGLPPGIQRPIRKLLGGPPRGNAPTLP